MTAQKTHSHDLCLINATSVLIRLYSLGLFKHYWILVKLILTPIATIVLLLHMQPITYFGQIASDSPLSLPELTSLRIRLIADAGAAMLVLLATTTISVYKPWGKIQAGITIPKFEFTTKKPLGSYLVLGFIVLIVLFITLHLLTGGMSPDGNT